MKRRTLSRQGKVYSFKRNVALKPWAIVNDVATEMGGALVSNQVVANNYTFGHMRFRLTDLPGNTDFTNLYERYKITGVKVKFIPVLSTVRTGDAEDTPISPLAIAINRGAITTAADDKTFDQLLENQDVRVYSTNKPFNVYIKYPKFYAPADGITQAQTANGWINAKSPAVHHFGLNWAFMTTTTETNSRTMFRVIATYYIKAANPQ